MSKEMMFIHTFFTEKNFSISSEEILSKPFIITVIINFLFYLFIHQSFKILEVIIFCPYFMHKNYNFQVKKLNLDSCYCKWDYSFNLINKKILIGKIVNFFII